MDAFEAGYMYSKLINLNFLVVVPSAVRRRSKYFVPGRFTIKSVLVFTIWFNIIIENGLRIICS